MSSRTSNSYQGIHTPSKLVPLHDLGNGEAVPADILNHPEWYTGHMNLVNEFWSDVLAAQGDPSHRVTIFRALPAQYDTFRTGDWITLSLSYAMRHSQFEEDTHIIGVEAHAEDVWWAGDDLVEWGYHGPDLPAVFGRVSGLHTRVARRWVEGSASSRNDRTE